MLVHALLACMKPVAVAPELDPASPVITTVGRTSLPDGNWFADPGWLRCVAKEGRLTIIQDRPVDGAVPRYATCGPEGKEIRVRLR